MRTKLTTAQVQQCLPKGVYLVGEWQGSKKKNRFCCDNGHTWVSPGGNIIKWKFGCRKCHFPKAKLTEKEVQERLPKGISLVGEWKGARKKNRFRCDNGHTWCATGTNPIYQKTGCRNCSAKMQKERYQAQKAAALAG